MTFGERIKEFVYSLSSSDKYSDYDSRKSFNRVNKPSAQTSLLYSHHNNSSMMSLHGGPPGPISTESSVTEGVHEVRLAWRHIKKWLHKHSPELNSSLSSPCTESDINEFQKDLGLKLPQCVVEFFRLTDGQSTINDDGFGGLLFGLKLMSIDEIAVMTESWSNVHRRILKSNPAKSINNHKKVPSLSDEGDLGSDLSDGRSDSSRKKKSDLKKNPLFANQRSVPPGSVIPIYAHSAWIPMITDGVGNCIGVDLSLSGDSDLDNNTKAPNGKWGQVIMFGRDFDTKFRLADNFGDFLLIFANDLEKQNWELRDLSDVNNIMCGLDTELLYVDSQTHKEIPYMDVLRKRCVDQWILTLSAEEVELPENKDLIMHLQETFSYRVPFYKESFSDKFLKDNLSAIDKLNAPVNDKPIPGEISHDKTIEGLDDDDEA